LLALSIDEQSRVCQVVFDSLAALFDMIPPGFWDLNSHFFSGESVLFLELKRIKSIGTHLMPFFGKTMTIHSLWVGDSEMSHLKHILLGSSLYGQEGTFFNCTILSSKSIFMLVD